MIITASIVTYNTNLETLNKAILSFLGTSDNNIKRKLFIVDNSPTEKLKNVILFNPRITYIFNPSNPGFGIAHNIAIEKAISLKSKYHFVINPDISTDCDIVENIVSYMEMNNDVGMCMPQILNSDGTVQYLPKLLPSPYSVLMRKLQFPKIIYKSFIDKYELRYVEPQKIYEAPILSGCFTVFRISVIKDLGGYDDRFFMYFEDWDISRRVNQKYKTIYFPNVSVYHDYESEANYNIRLLMVFIESAIKYFNKWGWLFDSNRRITNKKILSQFIKPEEK